MEYHFDFPIYKESTDESDNITALYIRYSALESAKESNDIEVQYEALKKHCLDNNVQNPVIFIADNVMGADVKRTAY